MKTLEEKIFEQMSKLILCLRYQNKEFVDDLRISVYDLIDESRKQKEEIESLKKEIQRLKNLEEL